MASRIAKYYLAENAYIYPSSNATDGGDNNSERNIRTITEKISISNFVVKREGKNPLGVTASPNVIKIAGGECVIQGYYINVADIEIPTADEAGAGTLEKNEKYNVILQLLKDGSGLVRGDGTVIENGVKSPLYCKGLMALLVTDRYLEEHQDDLDPTTLFNAATFRADESGTVSDATNDTIVENLYKYSFIDSETILTPDGVKIEDWVQNLVDHLNVLNYYESPDDETPTTSLIVEKGKVYRVSGTTRDEVLTRAEMATSNSTTDLATVSSVPTTDTQNGISGKVSRADHRHDGRYILGKLAGLAASVIQKVSSGLHVLGELRVGGTETAAKTVLKSDGSVSTAAGNLTVDASGNVTSKKVTATEASIAGGKCTVDTSGNVSTSGTITGTKVYNAVWNDYAEWYLSDTPDEVIEPGTVIAKVKGKDTYGVSQDCNKLVVGVCSDSYGHIVGGDSLENMEDNNGKYIPVAIAGRVRVKVLKGALIEEGDLLTVSAVPGLATASPRPEKGFILGKALESSDGTKSSVLMQVLLG